MKRWSLLTLLALLVVGCSPDTAIAPVDAEKPTQTEVAKDAPRTATVNPTATRTLPPSATVTALPPTGTPAPTHTDTPTATAVLACIQLYYEEYAQIELIDPAGRRVLVDIFDPEKLSSPVDETDILLTTHTHWDHYNPDFQADFPGEQVFVQEAEIASDGIYIVGLASAHNAGDRLKPEGGTNYIFLIEFGGLRIAHFGDIGQNSLTDKQLAVLGEIDLAITQLHNPYSDMSVENRKGIKLMEQLGPKLVIPTHVNLDSTKAALQSWVGYISTQNPAEICKADLPTGLTLLLMGEAAETYPKYIDLGVWNDGR